MKQWMRFGGVMTLALAVSACAGDDARGTNENAATPAARDSATAGTSGDARADQEFIREQLAIGEAEIELGRLAQQKGTHPEVKRFGEMMVRDHQLAGQELKQILSETRSGTEGATGTAGTDAAREDDEHSAEHREKLEDLRQLSGPEFDKKYIDQMVDDHQKAIDEVENRAENANNPDVKQWASKTLPKMQQHLERAKTIKETLENAGQ